MKEIRMKQFGLIVGCIAFLYILVMPVPYGLDPVGQKVLAMAVLMVVWWGTEAIPIPITALLPIVLLPVLGVAGAKGNQEIGLSIYKNYSHPVIMLALGIFMLAGAIVKWNLHKRIALNIVRLSGNKPSLVVLGFIASTAFISMWMSNTTATAMMIPVAMALLLQIGEDHKSSYGKCLVLSIPFAATLGGVGTVIGTGTNMTGVSIINTLTGIDISFYDWLKIGIPFVVVQIPVLWLFMVSHFKVNASAKFDMRIVNDEIRSLGPMGRGEKYTSFVFLGAVMLWLTRILWKDYLPYIGDDTISTLVGIMLFIIPVNIKKGEFLLDIKTGLESISWSTILLLGGALTMGDAFAKAGVADWIATYLSFLRGLPEFLVVILIGIIVAFLTEVTTNMVVVAAFLPMIAALAATTGISSLLLMITVTVCSSFAFMLPPATPPNAIAYGTGYIDIKDLMKVGLRVKLICLAIFPFIIYAVNALVLNHW